MTTRRIEAASGRPSDSAPGENAPAVFDGSVREELSRAFTLPPKEKVAELPSSQGQNTPKICLTASAGLFLFLEPISCPGLLCLCYHPAAHLRGRNELRRSSRGNTNGFRAAFLDRQHFRNF